MSRLRRRRRARPRYGGEMAKRSWAGRQRPARKPLAATTVVQAAWRTLTVALALGALTVPGAATMTTRRRRRPDTAATATPTVMWKTNLPVLAPIGDRRSARRDRLVVISAIDSEVDAVTLSGRGAPRQLLLPARLRHLLSPSRTTSRSVGQPIHITFAASDGSKTTRRPSPSASWAPTAAALAARATQAELRLDRPAITACVPAKR